MPAGDADRRGLFWRRNPNDMVADGAARGYRRTLGVIDLTSIGIAGIIGAGIFVVLGLVARDVAGPAVVISIVLAGIAAALTAMTFAEMAAMVPSSGGMYEYTFATMGRLPAFVVGWSVLMGYIVGNFAVAAGWSAFLVLLLPIPIGLDGLAGALTAVPADGGLVNLPAALAMLVVTGLGLLRIRTSTRVNNVLVATKILAVLAVVVVGLMLVNPANWRPFAPFGFAGVLSGAALMLFAYFGFDTVAAAGAEARDPQRSMPLGILGGVGLAGVLYVGMGAVVTGLIDLQDPNGPASGANAIPLIEGFSFHGVDLMVTVVFAGALVALTTVMYAYVIATARVMETMAADGLLPVALARVSGRTGIPWVATIVTGLAMTIGAGFLRLDLAVAATVAASGTAYILVVVGVIVLRRLEPDTARPFRVPLWVAWAAALVLVVIIGRGLSPTILAVYGAWVGLGLVYYGFRAHRRSVAVAGDHMDRADQPA